MNKLVFKLLLCFTTTILFSQNQYINQVLLLNEGSVDFYTDEIIEPVTIGSYDIQSNLYNTIIEIEGAKFASDLIIHNEYFYVAADNKLLQYHLDTYELIAEQNIPGLRKLVIYNDYLFISKGDYDLATFGPVIFDSYLEVYSTDDLSFVTSFNNENMEGPQWSTESMIIKDEKLYIAINNAYEWGNPKGLVGIVDLNSLEYLQELDLGEDGKNPINMLLKDDKIFTINNKNWDGSSVSIINSLDLNTETISLSNVSSGCGVSIIRGENLYYQISTENQMYKFDLINNQEDGVVDNLTDNYYAISQNPLNGNIYVSVSNFTSDNTIHIYDQNNNNINSFISDVATGKIVFDVRYQSTSIEESFQNDARLIKTIDILGRNNNTEGLLLEIYNNGNVNKKYLLK